MRMQSKMTILREFEDELAAQAKKLMEYDDVRPQIREIQYFIKKSLPTLLHVQISEAFQAILGNSDAFTSAMLDFETKKLRDIEIYDNNVSKKNFD